MTATTTTRDVRSPQNGRVPNPDSPAVRARARASIPTSKPITKSDRQRADVAAALRSWWAWTARPATLADVWQASAVDPKRIPASSTVLRLLWQVSNWTDRLLMFALIALAPTCLTGLLRWCATRPTRRYGLYLTAAALTAALIIGRTN